MTRPSAAFCDRAWLDVDTAAIVENARAVAHRCGARLLPMVKANGYGLGAVAVARALAAIDPVGYGVATCEEGAELRHAGLDRRIIVFTPLDEAWIDAYLAHDLTPIIDDLEALRKWTGATERPFHLGFDTGMSRAGFRWDAVDAIKAAIALAASSPGWEGAFTHFHSAEDDLPATAAQWRRFTDVVAGFPRRPPLLHAANSAAALRGREYAADLVRPGIFLYGGGVPGHTPRPVAALQARVIGVRRIAAGDGVSYGATWRAPVATTIATVAAGYADGILRAEGRERVAELRGREVPIVGRVTMDMCMLAVDDGEVARGDVVTIFGGIVSVDRQAAASGTIAYELLTAVGGRVPRHYGGMT